MNNGGKFLAGLTLGALAGAAISCLVHSQRGRCMRHSLRRTANEMEENAHLLAEQARQSINNINADIVNKLAEQAEMIKTKLATAAEKQEKK